jgi:hypothetical protein
VIHVLQGIIKNLSVSIQKATRGEKAQTPLERGFLLQAFLFVPIRGNPAQKPQPVHLLSLTACSRDWFGNTFS